MKSDMPTFRITLCIADKPVVLLEDCFMVSLLTAHNRIVVTKKDGKTDILDLPPADKIQIKSEWR